MDCVTLLLRPLQTPELMPGTSVALLAAILVAAIAPSAASALVTRNAALANAPDIASVDYPGLQHLHYRYGPISITPGQNTIVFRPTTLKPDVPGYITRFKPNLTYTNGKVPRVDILHLHHGVWLMRNYPTFAVGEEKTIYQFPQGFGYRYDPSDTWILNYMLHNLLPNRAQVYITWDIDFLPASEPAAQSITEVKPQWMDVSGLRIYPVFDALRGAGKNGRYTFPDDARGAQKANIGPAHEWTVPKDITLVSTAGHLHPGGLWTDLKAQRGSSTQELFRSEAKYFEPAGAVSWDVTMTAPSRTGASRSTRATRSRSRRPTTRAAPRGTRSWASWRPGTPRAICPAPSTRSPRRWTGTASSPTVTWRRTTTTAVPARRSCRTRRGCSRARTWRR